MFLDPHETHFGRSETGQRFSLKEQLLHGCPDQFMPYEDVLDCKISTRFYNGTLFRFPLRDAASDLSKKTYTAEKVRNLFEALKKEASVILLFLKNIEEIGLFETDERSVKRHVFTVRLTDSCRQEIRQKKKDLLTQVEVLSKGGIANTHLSLRLGIEEVDARGTRVENKWLVYHQVDARNSDLKELSSDLGLLPWVGFATPLNESKRKALSSTGGRIFCFLPLPPNADSKTGFPVHVHGYFGLTDNRRGLKWPGLDCQNDRTAEWNVSLLRHVASQTYAQMLLDLKETDDCSTKAELVYKSWPDLQEVENHWKGMLMPMFSILMNNNVFWTPANGGQWVVLQEARLDRIQSKFPNATGEVKDVVLATLTQANEPIVIVPSHVMKAIDTYTPIQTNSITPVYLRSLLKKKQKGSWKAANMPREKKIKLLEFALEDKNLTDMQGVPLLPLADGNFVDFRSLQYNRDPNAAVYVSSATHPRSLFHNMDSKFLDNKDKSPALKYLSEAASDASNPLSVHPMQLVKLNTAIALNLLRQTIPTAWFQVDHLASWYPGRNGHPSESWLECVWNWIQDVFATDLSPFEGFPLIPHVSAGSRSIVKLKTSSLAIRQHHQGLSLQPLIVSLLGKMGCVVLTNLPPYVRHNALHKYIASPNPQGALKVFSAIGQGRCVAMISSCSPEEKRVLRNFLSSTSFSGDQRNLLLHLPIFDAADGTSFIAAVEGCQARTVSPYGFQLPQSLPVPNASRIIALRDHESFSLLQRLGISVMTPATFLISTVFSGIRSSFYSHQQISTLMCWVLTQYYVFCNQDSSFKTSLRQLPFVVTKSNKVVTPCDVLDPQQPIMQKLFEAENDKVPHDDFVKGEILQPLRELGMRSVPNAEDLLHVARTLCNFPVDQASRKASTLLEFLNTNTLLIESNKTLAQALMKERWIQRMEKRPSSYPRSMPWFSGKGHFFKPCDVLSQSKANLVGASVALVSKPCNRALETAFGWNKSPAVHHLTQQLRFACSVALNGINVSERYHFQAMLKEIYKEASTNTAFTSTIGQDVSFPAWIWHGNGFTSPSKIAFVSPCKLNLKPYLYTVQQDFHDLRSFFQRCGVREAFNETDLLGVLEMIKDKHETSNELKRDVADDRKLSCDILQWIVRDGKPLNSELRKNLLVPVMTWDNTLNLVRCNECTFCDATWLRKGGSELPNTSQFPMIHETISTKTAELLGVPPISTRITCAEALGIEQTGPHEPITTRLKNILNEYKEGVGVFRELVQNADDAGATEVQFVLDWRSHPTEKLLSSGMADCQGPALLVYNNAIFTDDDLQNISKLAGATKKEDLEKIGRFGLGFSSVYHFTDVPSFISRSYAVFFDPHTRHLGAHIRDASKPGIKIDLGLYPACLVYFPDQFQPYNGLFGCDTTSPNNSEKFYFDGTLFRFGFRTKRGEINDKIYNRQEIKSLVHSFQESSSSLLLFTQNVKKVTFLEVEKNGPDPTNPRLLFEICKETVNEFQPCQAMVETTFLQSCAEWTRRPPSQNMFAHKEPPPKLSQVISVSSKINGKNGERSQETCSWLITSCLGIGDSFQLATSEEGKKQGLLSASGIAGKISSDNGKDGCLSAKAVPGEVFCFLPLSIPTGLPVHVNGYFAVTSNRRGIWEGTTADVGRQPLEVRWNAALMKDAVSQTYIQLLEDIMHMQQQGKIPSYQSFSLWPNPETLQSSAWEPLIKSVYQQIAKSELPLVRIGEEWLPVTHCIYQDAKLQELPKSYEVLEILDYRVVKLPDFARKGFKQAGCIEMIEQQTMTQKKFLEEVFFPNIMTMPDDLRDPIVCHLLDQCLQGHSSPQSDNLLTFYKSLLSTKRCIPCGPDEGDLASPKKLISPRSRAATLFSADEKRFPVGKRYCTRERLLMLEKLGMASNLLDWTTLLERANSVPLLCRKAEQDARKRVAHLVKYINVHLNELDCPTEWMKSELMGVSMFPVLSKPASYTMPWRGSDEITNGNVMLPAEEMYGDEFKFVAGSSRPVLDESEDLGCGKLNKKTRELFGFSHRKPSVQEVFDQLDYAIRQATVHSPDESDSFEDVFHSIYDYLQEPLLKSDGEDIVEKLKDRCWILVHGKCLSSDQLAFKWKKSGEPYLHEVPKTLAEKYRRLFQATGIKENFCIEDVIHTLYKLSEDKCGKCLSEAEFKVSRSLLEELLEAPEHLLQRENGKIPLPDHNLFLQSAEKLAINDAPWVTARTGTAFVHKHVPIDLAYKLGATDIRTKKVAEKSRPIGKPFGQHEELTNRLKGILKAYPCDVGILKELVQNADDAGASELHFIYDPRNHPTERLLSDNWKELQGPALCVYNDRPFSEKDLEGIQRLGIGSKTDDPTKTGQYGIGFNAVYHLTDCPSFISNGDTLCILDPHCRYAPGATKENPGLMIEPIGEEERSDYRDIFHGYLENLKGDFKGFDLSSATLFRFPLRNQKTSTESLISQKLVSSADMINFMNIFTLEAKEILLFLNHVKKITLSEIKDDQLKEIYSVSAQLTDEDAAQRVKLANHVKTSKALETNEIDWLGITYPLFVRERNVREEKWLIHQCIGLQRSEESEEVPDGRSYGLLPRGGIAAKVAEKSKFHFSESKEPKHKAFCFLPLPLNTGLPVHVNGHFYLDSARRNLWHDEKEEGFGSKWNCFIITKVLAQAYVALLLVAREFLPGLKKAKVAFFTKEYKVHEGMRWYENLFPHFDSVKSQWKGLAEALFQTICDKDEKLLPLAKKTLETHQVTHQTSDETGGEKVTRCFWLPPSEAFFNTMMSGSESDIQLKKILLMIDFKLLYSSHRLFNDFKKAGTKVKEIKPEVVVQFLKEHPNNIGNLPCPVSKTALGSVVGVLLLLSYCMTASTFLKEMFGVPLLLTEDDVLRRFRKDHQVFLSLFADLVPNQRSQFMHQRLASALIDSEKEIVDADQGVLKKFDVGALASLLPSTANASWGETNTLIPWHLDKGPSKSWLQRLWEFLSKIHKKSPDSFSLEPLRKWPILPTQSGQLAPVSKGKVILDLTTSESWSPGQERVVILLRKLKCHEVDTKLITRDGRWDVSRILKPHLSYPNSSQDILKVLDHLMNEADICGCLCENEMISILQFLQDDVASLKRDQSLTSIVKRLPFFKTFHKTFVRLDDIGSVYVIPEGLPTDESDVWMRGNNCVFLAPAPKLDRLYKELLGVGDKTHADCYINFIFPKFPNLKQTTRMLHLAFVRRFLLAPYSSEEQHARVLKSLTTLAFIPDTNETPQMASHFFDPGVKIFAVMLPRDAKPPEPFNEKSGWLDLLRKIGLKQQVSKETFLQFSSEVAEQAENMSKQKHSELERKSRVLVTHLFNDKSLHDVTYLRKLSTLKFVATSKASDELLSLHRQHQCTKQSQDGVIPFSHFHGSIPETHEKLAWTAACLLPCWAVPNTEVPKLKSLGVLEEPSIDQVIAHVTKLSQSLLKYVDRDQPEPKRRLLNRIMTEVYKFFQRVSRCQKGDLDSCSQVCHEVGKRLSEIPFILVDDGRVFVRGDQLAFDLDEQLPPYLYRVPREYGVFEHLFKRLGAMEEATPVQFAKLLSRLKESCQDQTMHPNELTVAKHAVYGLFATLKAIQDRSGNNQQDNPLVKVETLYLPSSDQKLQRSTNLVLFDCPQYTSRIPHSMYEFLDKLHKYNLKFATPRQIVDLLPVHLQTQSLALLVREDLHPECRDKKCRADMEKKCQPTNHLRQILSSPQLVNGIMRILKFQFQKAKLTEEVCNNVHSFQKELRISCMEELATELVETGSNTPLPDSRRSKHMGCFVEQEETGRKHIFVKHGVDPSNVRRVLCKEINQLTGCYIDKESWLHLAAILECKSPDTISSILDNAGVSQDVEAVKTPRLEPELGSEVPEELHELLLQYDDFFFRPGEFVAYEREDSTDEEPKYIYAQIIHKLNTPHAAKPRKDKTKRKQKGESNLLSRYLIDIGREKKEVDVLDLYKIKRPQQMHDAEDDGMEEESVSDSTEVVPYVGGSGKSAGEAKAGSSTSAEPPKPKTLQNALKEVKKALAEIWKLPEDKRTKAVKRLYLRWHPDKNMDMQDIANEVTKFIQNEVEKLSKGGSASREEGYARAQPDFSDFFRQWHQRAQRQRSSYENFRRHNPRFTGFASHSRRRYTGPDARLSKMWIRQSREDLRSIEHLLAARNPLYYLVCFQCHQVAEKALKAALYAFSGIADRQLNTHDLVQLAHDLSLLAGAPDVTSLVAKLSDYYDTTRYPDKHVPAKVPADVFQNFQQAQEAFRLAKDVLDKIEPFVDV